MYICFHSRLCTGTPCFMRCGAKAFVLTHGLDDELSRCQFSVCLRRVYACIIQFIVNQHLCLLRPIVNM